jgi:hypothetical protein
MTGRENIQAKLETLLELGCLPKSACGRAFMKFLKPLLDSGVIVEERAGAGRRLTVRDAATLRKFKAGEFPNATVAHRSLARIAAVARFRDSKALAGDTPDVIMLRAWSDGVLMRNGQPVTAAQATTEHGVFAIHLADEFRYELRGVCGLVENPALFAAFEPLREQSGVALALYGGGRIPRRVLQHWLAKQAAPDFRLVHFPDYDPVGLNEFVRLRTALGPRVTLHLPADLPERFARFSKRKLLQRPASQALLSKLRRAGLSEVDCVLELIERHNAGLEQEALLVRASSCVNEP